MNINLTLTIEETNIVLKGLCDLPFKESAALINKIKLAADEQIEEATDGTYSGR